MHKMTTIKKLLLLLLILFFVCFSVFYFGIHRKSTIETADSGSTLIQFHVQVDPDRGYQQILSDAAGKRCSKISTYDLSEILVEADGDLFSIEDAVSQKILSPESVYAQALIDSQNNVCRVSYSSNLGLSKFVFLYEEYELLIRHDIFEAANGVEYLINDLIIAAPGEAIKLRPGYQYSGKDGTVLNLLAEDWGIQWDVKEISPTSLTANCVQYGGQQVGDLEIIRFRVFDHKWGELPVAEDQSVKEQIPVPIQMNTTSELLFDWESMYGKLNAGEYYLYIVIQDKYDTIHPFLQKYSDTQQYFIPFTIS